jgi:hypothetical protein
MTAQVNRVLAVSMKEVGKVSRIKIYPRYGKSPKDGNRIDLIEPQK